MTITRRGLLRQLAALPVVAAMLSMPTPEAVQAAPALDAECGRRWCEHEYGDHYTTNSGTAGCSEVEGYEGEKCSCAGFTAEREEPAPIREATGPAAFIPMLWSEDFVKMIERPSVLATRVNRDFEQDWKAGDIIKVVTVDDYRAIRLTDS